MDLDKTKCSWPNLLLVGPSNFGGSGLIGFLIVKNDMWDLLMTSRLQVFVMEAALEDTYN